ncbi:MAG: choice-of-anchor D domain-containing protein [Propionivibrio sp.]|nr:choice-of-anchor D domain-containing protein [Propionivibrio sp.]
MDGGTLTVQDGSGVAGGTRIGLAGTGTFTQNAGTHNTTYIEIGGTNFAQGSGGTGVYNLNGGTLVSSGAISTNPQGGSSGTLNVAGGTLTAPVIINKDTVNYSGGSIAASINNSANVNVSGGAARILTGDLSNNSGGTVTVAAATPLTITGVLTQAAGASIKSDANITVGKDYNNLGAGNGNSFDRHAGVTSVAGGTFASQIIGNNAAQTITGNVASGGTDTFTLDLGNVRGGSGPVTKNYQIANNGTGADIRGAIQTAGANGGNITDGRLSGTGVTAGNFGPIAAGANSGDLAVTLSGPGVALTGQKVAIVSNFDNVSTQIINLTGGAVSALAVGNATPNSPSPVALDNFRVGTAGADTSFNVQNQTSGAGAEQLGINSAVASSGFSANNAFGAGLIGPGASATGAVTAKASGSGTAGVNTGTVTINYATDGTNIDAAFARQAANQQVINVQATGYNAAVGSAAPGGTINLGNFHVGQAGGAAPQSQGIDITNTVAGPFTESLGVGTASVDNAAFNLSNSIGSGLVAAGATSNGALSIARTGGTAGVNTGTVTIQYTTDGTGTSGLSAINSNTQNITVNASGYNLAQSNVIAPINIVGHTGDGFGLISQALSITNVAGHNDYQED